MVTPPLRATPAGRQIQLHAAEMVTSIGVALAAIALLALIWLVEARSVETQTNDLRARVEATVETQAVLLAEQIRREMLGVEQSLHILGEAFQADPDHFDMNAWRQRMPALTDVMDDVFIADEKYIIRHDINPAEVGLGMGSRVPGMFHSEAGKPDPDAAMLIAPTMQTPRTRQYTLLLILRLDRPGGWLVGASYKTSALQRLFAEANLGPQGMTALIDTRLGRVEAVAGPAAANPNYDIASSPMYAAMQLRPDDTWIGASAPDGVQRIHGFRRVPGRQLATVVAVDAAQAMGAAAAWGQDARALAAAASMVVLAAALVALYAIWTFRSKRRLRQSLERELGLVNNAQAELNEARSRLGGRVGQVQALLAGVEEGVLLLDGELRLAEWNRHMPGLLGVAPEFLQPGLPLDDVLRRQASEGAFGPLDDMEAEITRRLARLRSGSETVPAIYPGPEGRSLAVFASRHPDGSLLLIMRTATEHDLRPAPEEPVLESSPGEGSTETF
jgi:PAS domain-containing protein